MSVGILTCSYNDLDMAKGMYQSLLKSMPSGYAYGLCVVDAGSTDGSVEFWEGKTALIHAGNQEILDGLDAKGEDLKHLSRALNIGAEWLIRGEASYILHIHPDMLFPQHDWITTMVEYLQRNPDIGKLAADWTHLNLGDREGNQCPWMMPTSVIQEVRDKYGYYFDPEFLGIGGSEDWDLNARLIQMGYRVTITSDVLVEHEGMGTRSRHDTNQDALHNRGYYVTKWGTHQSPV